MKTNGKSQVEVPGASPGFSFLGWIMIIRIFFGSRCSRHRLWIGVLSGGFAGRCLYPCKGSRLIESLGPTKPKKIVAAGSFISEPYCERNSC